MAAEGVEPQQRGVDQQDDGADADADAARRPGLLEGHDGVDGQDDVEDEAEVEEVAVDVLEEEREPGLTGVGAVAVGHRAGRRGQPEATGSRPCGSSSRSSGSPSGKIRMSSAGEIVHQERVGAVAGARARSWPSGTGSRRARSGCGGSRRRRSSSCSRRRPSWRRRRTTVSTANGDHRLDPVAVGAQGRDVGPAPRPAQHDRGYAGLRPPTSSMLFSLIGPCPATVCGRTRPSSVGRDRAPTRAGPGACALTDRHLSTPGPTVRNNPRSVPARRPRRRRGAPTLHAGTATRRLVP